MSVRTRPLAITKADEEGILALNNAHAAELSLLDAARLSQLLETAFYARAIGGAEAFLIAFDEGADYDSPNYLWFRIRHPRFVYVDRVAVGPDARGQGLARALYLDLFGEARRAGHGRIVCEVNLDPPNPGSDAFHAAMGFAEVGAASIHGGAKRVRYLERRLV